jgi:hypothetical protein
VREARLYPQERGAAGLEWLKRAATVFVLLILLTAYMLSVLHPAPAWGAKATVPAAGSPEFAIPKDLPSKGSLGAKLVMVMFTEFH